MNNFKKITVCMLALTTVQELTPNNGNAGAFFGGAALATGITLAATSGSRNRNDGDYYEARREDRRNARARSDLRQEIKEMQREITKLNKKIRTLEKDIEKSHKHKFSDDEIKNKREEIADHKREVRDHKDHISDLKDELKNIY